jgi:hypothetical protein
MTTIVFDDVVFIVGVVIVVEPAGSLVTLGIPSSSLTPVNSRRFIAGLVTDGEKLAVTLVRAGDTGLYQICELLAPSVAVIFPDSHVPPRLSVTDITAVLD